MLGSPFGSVVLVAASAIGQSCLPLAEQSSWLLRNSHERVNILENSIFTLL